jgi:hypothetical protein
MDADFEGARLFYGRPYWNLGAVKGCVRKLPGFVEREFDLDLAVQPSYSGDGARTPASLWNVLKESRRCGRPGGHSAPRKPAIENCSGPISARGSHWTRQPSGTPS